MTFSELKEKINSIEASPEAEASIRYSDSIASKISDVCTSGESVVLDLAKSDGAMFRISYLIKKDGRTCVFDMIRKDYADANEVAFSLDDLKREVLESYLEDVAKLNVDWSRWDQHSMVIVSIEEMVLDVDPKTKKAEYVEKTVEHEFTCTPIEVFQEVDLENDVLVRVWKSGRVC